MSKRILVVDDEEDIVVTLTALLEMKNYETLVARNGQEALDLLETERPDLIVLDLMMPKVSGLQVCKTLKADPEMKDIPILVLSAIGQNSDKSEEFWKLGLQSDDFIGKPFDANVVLGRIEYLLRKDQYVSAGNPGNTMAPAPDVNSVASADFSSPESTIRVFVEAYNNQNFDAEFEALSSKLSSMYPPKDQYIMSRTQVFQREKSYQKNVSLDKVVSKLVKESSATYLIIQKEEMNGASRGVKLKFELEKEGSEWKITRIQPLGNA